MKDIAAWETAARVHGERFGHVRPANTLVQAALVGPDHLVEIEAEANVPEPDSVQSRHVAVDAGGGSARHWGSG